MIGKLFLGHNDGLEEWSRIANVEAYFYNHEHLVERAQDPQRWLFLGKKGTGKSILGAYLVESTEKHHGLSALCSYKHFQIQQLETLKNSDVAPNQYINIWKWILLIELGKLLRLNQALVYDPEHERLCTFFDKNFPERPIDASKIVEITKMRKVTGELNLSKFKIGLGSEKSSKEVTADYSNYLPDLENVVMGLVARSNVPYLVVIDELDHRFRRNDLYHDCITGLLYATSSLNRALYLAGRSAKVAVMLRTDICNWLNDVDINKIRADPAMRLEIDWGTSEDYRSPLFDLVLRKINASLPEEASSPRIEQLIKWFPSDGTQKGERYLLSRTLLRPRDLITFLNFAKDETNNAASFSHDVLRKVERHYSNYLLGEIKNELKGHIPDEEIDAGFLLLAHIGKPTFLYSELESYCKEHTDEKACTNPKQFLSDMFEFSVLGNGYYSQKAQATRQRWAYKAFDVGLTKVDLSLSMHIHPGLLSALGIRSSR